MWSMMQYMVYYDLMIYYDPKICYHVNYGRIGPLCYMPLWPIMEPLRNQSILMKSINCQFFFLDWQIYLIHLTATWSLEYLYIKQTRVHCEINYVWNYAQMNITDFSIASLSRNHRSFLLMEGFDKQMASFIWCAQRTARISRITLYP